MKPAPLRAFFFLPNDRVGIWAGDPTRIAASLYWRGDPKPAARGSRIAARVAGDGWKSNGKLPRVADHGAGITARGSSAAGIVGGGVGWKSNGKLPNRRRGTSTGKQTDETLARFGRDRSGSGRARRVEVKRKLPNRRRETSNGDQTDETLARFGDRGSRIGRGSIVGVNRGSGILAPIGEDRGQIAKLLIGLANRGSGSADRGTFQTEGGRRGAACFTS